MNKEEIVGTLIGYAVRAEKLGNELLCEAFVNLALLVSSGEVPAGFDTQRGIWVEEETGKKDFIGAMTTGGSC